MSKFVFQKNFDIFVTFENVVLVFFKCARQQQLIKKVLNVPPPPNKKVKIWDSFHKMIFNLVSKQLSKEQA